MDIFKDYFLGLDYLGPLQISLRLLCLFAIAGLLLWLLWLGIYALEMRKSKRLHADVLRPLSLFKALIAFMVLYAVYFFFLIKVNGLHVFRWTFMPFYTGISPQLLLFVTAMILFFASYGRFTKKFKTRY